MRNPIIINVRGTSGAGKSTLVKSIMQMYDNIGKRYIEGRKQPMGYLCHRTITYDTQPKLFIPGHYESACGGCDTISHDDTGKGNSYDRIFGIIREQFALGHDVLFEGLLLSGDAARCTLLKKDGLPLTVVCINIPVQECVDSVKARRAAAGNEKPFNEKNTRDKHRLMQNCMTKLRTAGVDVRDCPTRDLAALAVADLLGLIPENSAVGTTDSQRMTEMERDMAVESGEMQQDEAYD